MSAGAKKNEEKGGGELGMKEHLGKQENKLYGI